MRKGWLIPLVATAALACNALLGIDGEVIEGAHDDGGAEAAPLPASDGAIGDDGGPGTDYRITPIAPFVVVQGAEVDLDVVVTGPDSAPVSITLSLPTGLSVVSQSGPVPLGTPTHLRLRADTFAVQGPRTLKVLATVSPTLTLSTDVPLEVTGPFDTTFGDGGLVVIPFRGTPATNSLGLYSSDVGLAVTDAGIYVAFSTANNLAGNIDAFALKRLKPDGQDDPNFADGGIARYMPLGPNDEARAHAAVALSDGGVLVTGEVHLANSSNNASYFAGVVWDTGASFAVDAGITGTQALRSAVATNDVAYAAGCGTSNSSVVVRIVDGAIDPSFGGPFGSEARIKQFRMSGYDVRRAPDGAILLFGQTCGFTPAGGCTATSVRYFEDGGLDNTFGEGGVARAVDGPSYGFGGEVLGDGGILYFGARGGPDAAGSDPTDQHATVTRLLPSGFVDPSFGGAGVFELTELQASRFYGGTVLPDGSMLLAGAGSASSIPTNRTIYDLGNLLVKIDAAGNRVTSWGANGVARVLPTSPSPASQFRRMAPQNGKQIVAGLQLSPNAATKLDVILVRVLP